MRAVMTVLTLLTFGGLGAKADQDDKVQSEKPKTVVVRSHFWAGWGKGSTVRVLATDRISLMESQWVEVYEVIETTRERYVIQKTVARDDNISPRREIVTYVVDSKSKTAVKSIPTLLGPKMAEGKETLKIAERDYVCTWTTHRIKSSGVRGTQKVYRSTALPIPPLTIVKTNLIHSVRRVQSVQRR